jgi:hypothetical protein
VSSWWIIGLAAALYTVEFLATLIPGVASLWETVHAFIRPVAGAGVAAATVWGDTGPGVTIAAPCSAARWRSAARRPSSGRAWPSTRRPSR